MKEPIRTKHHVCRLSTIVFTLIVLLKKCEVLVFMNVDLNLNYGCLIKPACGQPCEMNSVWSKI